MAESRSARLALPRYDVESDAALDRPDWEEHVDRLEERAAVFGEGARPAAGVRGRIWREPDPGGAIWWDDGAEWRAWRGAGLLTTAGGALTGRLSLDVGGSVDPAVASLNADALPAFYPVGFTRMVVNSGLSGWPCTFGTAVTVRGVSRTEQTVTERVTGARWIRVGNIDDSAWGTGFRRLVFADETVRSMIWKTGTGTAVPNSGGGLDLTMSGEEDPGGLHAADAAAIVVPAGVTWCQVSGRVAWASTSTAGLRGCMIRRAGATMSGEMRQANTSTTLPMRQQVTASFPVVAEQAITLWVYQSSGADLATLGDSQYGGDVTSLSCVFSRDPL